MKRRGRVHRLGCILLVLAGVASGCQGSRTDGVAKPPTAVEQPRRGGVIVIAAGEPVCADWYDPCGAGHFGIASQQTLPSPMTFIDGQYRPTALLAGEPVAEPGPPQKVTYRIAPEAVWSDGTPITSADFTYTWEQGRALNIRGMGEIASVDEADPKAAVVTWKEPSAIWRDRFRPILPKHLLDRKDRNAEMKDGYRFSGGPWMIDRWTRGQEIKFVRNPRYWGPPTHLDAVVSRVINDASAVQQAYKSGQLDMFIQTGAATGIEEMKGLADTAFVEKSTLAYAFLSFNTRRPPLDRKPVRQALAYASDRDAIATQLQGHLRPGVRPIQSLASLANPTYYTEPFARYRRDLAKVADLMRSDGWSKGADGVWVQADARARVELLMSVGNFNSLLAQVFKSQWEDAGFEVAIKSIAGPAQSDLISRGDYQVGGSTAGGTTSDPGQCLRFCSKNIPADANRFAGGNVTRISSPILDDVWGRVDTELDTARRTDLVRRGQEALAEEVPVLPLVTIIDVYVFNSRKLGGSISVGPGIPALNEWFCRTTCE